MHLGFRRVFPTIIVVLSAVGSLPSATQGQDTQWERREEATQPPLTIFHSTQAINLPTAETLARGDWQFEIAHRFLPPLSEGSDALWGFDGPVNMRFGLGYAPTDRLMVTVARSNFLDNWDLQAKFKVLGIEGGPLPLMVALQGGAAWSSDVPERDSGDPGNFQYYGQVILNTQLGDRLALGLVPSYLYNVLLDRIDPVQDLYLGLYGQLFLTNTFSLNAEWSLGENRAELGHDPGAIGLELETGGHFFKIFLTNSVRLNPTQFLVGTDFPFQGDELRLGFAITRLLHF